jgi:hypothetical protein
MGVFIGGQNLKKLGFFRIYWRGALTVKNDQILIQTDQLNAVASLPSVDPNSRR